MASINKVINEFDLYMSGCSIPEVSEQTGIPLSTLRFRFKKAGILRDRAEAIKNAVERGRIVGKKGVKRHFTETWKANISKAKQIIGRNNAVGIDTSKGYPRFTNGEHKGKFVHQVVMELWLGRELVDGECVHHIDGDKSNNCLDNLALMTTSGHAKLHRLQDELSGNQRERNSKGEFK